MSYLKSKRSLSAVDVSLSTSVAFLFRVFWLSVYILCTIYIIVQRKPINVCIFSSYNVHKHGAVGPITQWYMVDSIHTSMCSYLSLFSRFWWNICFEKKNQIIISLLWYRRSIPKFYGYQCTVYNAKLSLLPWIWQIV